MNRNDDTAKIYDSSEKTASAYLCLLLAFTYAQNVNAGKKVHKKALNGIHRQTVRDV